MSVVSLVPTVTGFNIFIPAGLDDNGNVLEVCELFGNTAIENSYVVSNGNTVPRPILSGYTGNIFSAISDNGIVVGQSYNGSTTSYEGTEWTSAGAIDLGVVPKGGSRFSPVAVNNSGVIIGSFTNNNSPYNAAEYVNGVLTAMPTGPYTGVGNVVAAGINNQGVIVGSISAADGFHAVKWVNNVPIDLGLPTNSSSSVGAEALGINNKGVIVGLTFTKLSITQFNYSFFIDDNGSITLVALPTGFTHITNALINDAGQVVVDATGDGDVNPTAFLYTGGQLVSLGNYVAASYTANKPSYHITKVTGLNQYGQFLGEDAWTDPKYGNLGNNIVFVASPLSGSYSDFEPGQTIDLPYAPYNPSATVLSYANGTLSMTEGPADYGSASVASKNVPNLSALNFFVQSDGAGGTAIGIKAVYTAAAAIASFNAGSLTSAATVIDTAANVSSNIDGLQLITAVNKLAAINLTDGGIPVVAITAVQAQNDAATLNDIAGNYSLTQSAGSAAQTIVGVSSALGNTVSFSGNASQYTITPAGDGQHFSVSANGVTDQLSNIQALQFADHTVIVAAKPSTTSVTTGNITELYGAVFGREPDVAGLDFYLKYQQANPTTGLLQYANYFRASPEYANNSAHNYSQTVAGDQQFITDSYKNLLGRTPSAAEISFYETGVIAPALNGLTAGTSAYAAAQNNAHALVLGYFSQSPEFLTDVQITGANPASASHWLLLI